MRAEFYELVDFEPLEKRICIYGGRFVETKNMVGDKHLVITKGSVKK